MKLIFTDLDGTLLDDNYSFKKARPALSLIKKKKVPLIICTSKTRSEIEFYRKKLNNNHPFISENGGAIFIPKNYFKKVKYDKKIGNYKVIELGTGYRFLKKNLKKIENKLGNKIKIISFSDMQVEDLMKDSGLSLKEARTALDREYDEPFKMVGKKANKRKALEMIKKYGLNHTGGGRYHHILGNNDKGKAIKILKKIYKENYKEEIKTIGLGDSLNDREMLDIVDTGFLLQKPNKKYANVKNKNLTKVRGISSEGWNKTVYDLFWKFHSDRADKLYLESINVLKKLQLPNGAILASSPKGRYPYVYPRDHAVCILAMIDAGLFLRAKKALSFVLDSQNKSGSFPQRLDKKGRDASYKPIQLDNTGLVLYTFAKYIQSTLDKDFLSKYKVKINKSILYLDGKLNKKNLFFTPNSIHEFPPYEEGLEVWANATCYGALKELKKIGIKIKIDLSKIKKAIEKNLWNGKYFIKNIRLDESSSIARDVDASSYALADFGVFEDDNEKIKSTVKQIEKNLWHERLGGICRYKKYIGRNNGGWGPWPHFTLMIARHFIKLGERKKAEKYLEWVLNVSYKNQLPEHIATKKEFEEWANDYKKSGILRKDREIMVKNIRKTKMYKKGIAYSVLPLAWPHAEFIRTWVLYNKLISN